MASLTHKSQAEEAMGTVAGGFELEPHCQEDLVSRPGLSCWIVDSLSGAISQVNSHK